MYDLRMRKFLSGILIFLFLVIRPVWAFEVESYEGRVTDKAGLFSANFKTELEDKLAKIDEETGAEIAVLTIDKLPEASIEEYAVKVFEDWGIGKAKEDNGVLLLVAKENREVRIEVGYGLEPVITDGRAGSIIRDEIIPQFKLDNYELGVMAGVEKIETYIKGGVVEEKETSLKGTSGLGELIQVTTLGFLFITYLASFLARTKEFISGGIVGFLLGLIFGNFWVGVVSGIFGLIFDMILSRGNKGIGKYRFNPSSSIWKSSGFKSGGGGGFGGFGGGRSGGGGASGKW